MLRAAACSRFGIVLALALVLAGGVGASEVETAAARVQGQLEIDAPEPLRTLLRQHLKLDVPAAGAHAQARLIRRAQQEAPALLATEGYFSPRIDIQRSVDAPESVRLVVAPGPRTQVGAVDIVFRGALAAAGDTQQERRQRLIADWPLKVGSPFRSADWEAAKLALINQLAAADYLAVRLAESRAEVDPEASSVRLTLLIDTGSAYRFGALEVIGLQRYDLALVKRLAPFARGEPYRRDALLGLQAALQNTPWFQSVMVEADPANAQDGEVPVRVTVTEAQTRHLGLGLGYSTNHGARGEINYRDHDFIGRAWDFRSRLRLEQKQQSLALDLGLQPDADGYRLAFGGRLERSDIEGLLIRRQVLGANRSRVEGRIETRLGLEWQREQRRPDGGLATVDDAVVLDWRWVRRAVDDFLQPRSGNVIDFRIGGASRHLLSDRDFLRTHLRVQQWWPLGARDTLSVRGEAGYTAASSRFGIPQDYLFRAGGGQSVRGYAYQSLGVEEGDAIVGGRALLAGSIEYTHWLSGPWGAAVFVDVGDAADQWGALRLATGVGFGVRWQSPAGPLALDLARASRDGRWRPHFALMVAF